MIRFFESQRNSGPEHLRKTNRESHPFPIISSKHHNNNMFKLRILDLLAVIAATLTGTAYVWTQNAYRKIATNTPIAIDRYVGETEPAFTDKLQCVLVHYTAKWAKTIHKQPFPIVADQHRFIHGLKRTRAARQSEPPTQSDKPKPPLVIGTIRK